MAEHDQRFDSFTQWVDRASSWLTRRSPHEKAICLDAKNRVCRNGGDMMRARDEGAFPVRWLWPDDVAAMAARQQAREAATPCPWDLPGDDRSDREMTDPCPVCGMLGTPDAEDKCFGGPRRSPTPMLPDGNGQA